tara:strand:+ start:163 stop:318 length:156 start_codon:yes stop_codon:yes gene_type:complete
MKELNMRRKRGKVNNKRLDLMNFEYSGTRGNEELKDMKNVINNEINTEIVK